MRAPSSVLAGVMLLMAGVLPLHAAVMHPVERQLRSDFPSVPVGSPATFETADENVGRGMITGLRARFAQSTRSGVLETTSIDPGETTLRVTYPRFYGDPLVASFGEQRVVLRAVKARSAIAEAAGGMLIYRQPYPSVDTVQVPGSGRSEELMLLQDKNAPLVYDFEIVEMLGVRAAVMDGGAIRFLPEGAPSAVSEIAGVRFTPVPRVLRIERPWVIDATGRRSEDHAKWALITEGAVPKMLRLTVDGGGLSYPLLVDPSFSVSGSLSTARTGHTATLLQNGKIFVAGGVNSSGTLFTWEVFDPISGTVTATGNMADFRESHTATLLRSGKVLLVGGWNGSGSTTLCEVFDPSNNTITPTGSLATARRFHTATVLASGKVLIAGGVSNALGPNVLSSAELYDPSGAGTFGPTGSMAGPRASHTATLLIGGKVLLAGGGDGVGFLASAELYDPASTGTFGSTGALTTSRSNHTATLMADGRVLIAGGMGPSSAYRTSAEIYNPASGGTFGSTGSLATGRRDHTATLLPNGKVLIAGGQDTNSTFTSTAELYDPVAGGGTFSAGLNLNSARGLHTATLLPSAQVLIVAGNGGSVSLSSTELFNWAAGTFASPGSMAASRQYPAACLLPNGTVLIAGGFNAVFGTLSSAEIFNPASGFGSTGSLVEARQFHTATLLTTGKVLIVGGSGTAELYDFALGTFALTSGGLHAARSGHTATLLPNGKVLIVGGDGGGGVLASAELYDPATGTFATTGSLSVGRDLHTATLLASGKVLIAGGFNAGALTSAEVYDPSTGKFSSPPGSLTFARDAHTATLLPNGKVLIAGGLSGGGSMRSAELYDPVSGTFSVTGSLIAERYSFTASLLPNGKVLAVGGVGVSAVLSTAELYDPLLGVFSNAGSSGDMRSYHAATLLPSGKLLIAGGYSGSSGLSSASTYDMNLGYLSTRAPLITSGTTTLTQAGTIALTGSHFAGDSEASGGSLNSSATNYPLLQLQRVDNEQMFFVPPGTAWSDTAFTSVTMSNIANGYYRATLITNAIPSTERLILVLGGVPPSPPLAFTATATSASAVALTWPVSANATGYEVYRSSLNGPFLLDKTVTTNSATDTGLASDTTYLYKVRATSSAGASAFTPLDWATTTVFTDGSLFGVPIKAVHITQLRTAVNAVRVAVGLPVFVFTDTNLSGVTVQRVHLIELRMRLDEARSQIGLTAISYQDPTITAGSTLIKANHLLQLRDGTQ